ncbi:hypothetical protein ACQJBY_046600 [Aegilops geniculata]
MESAQKKKVGSMEVEMPGVVPVSATVAALPAAVGFVSVWGALHPLRLVPRLRRLGAPHLRTVHVLSAEGRGGERPGHRDRVLRRTPGGGGGAGCAAPVPPRLGPLRLGLPRPRAHHRRPLDVLRPSTLLLQNHLHRRHLRVRCGRYHLLPGPPPWPPPGRLGEGAGQEYVADYFS